MTLRDKITRLENFQAIAEVIPNDTTACQYPGDYVAKLAAQTQGRVLDLGCGEGGSIDLFRRHAPGLAWHGVDIEGSPENQRLQRSDGDFKTFDGVNLPYEDGSFAMLFCNQVLEHVRHPDQLIPEAFRVMQPGAWFVGSVSYLEPFHSYSLFNFTPLAIKRVFQDAGFEVLELRPGVDASHLINRQLLNRSRALRFFWRRSYLYAYVGLIGRLFSLDKQQRNFLKLMYAGHISFLARKPENSDHA